jgi:hypothetical protein
MDASWARSSRTPGLLQKFARQAIDAVNTDGEFDKPLFWYYSPMDSAWSLGNFPNRGVVYDCMDELSQFTGAPASLVENEARLMKFADIVFTGGYELGEKKRQKHDNVHTFGCGVDYGHFSRASDPTTAIPPNIDFMSRPILGWFGVVDERVDYAMVGEMARLRPAWSFAMVGPVVKVDPNLLPHAPNLFWLGTRDYQMLPHYCRAFDVNMMCFAINAATQFINPTKGLEYMATGKPIVSTPMRDVVRQWSDAVRIARSAEEFVAAAEEALKAGPADPRIVRGTELSKQNSWESTVEKMQRLIGESIGKKDRRSSQKIEPLLWDRRPRPRRKYLPRPSFSQSGRLDPFERRAAAIEASEGLFLPTGRRKLPSITAAFICFIPHPPVCRMSIIGFGWQRPVIPPGRSSTAAGCFSRMPGSPLMQIRSMIRKAADGISTSPRISKPMSRLEPAWRWWNWQTI